MNNANTGWLGRLEVRRDWNEIDAEAERQASAVGQLHRMTRPVFDPAVVAGVRRVNEYAAIRAALVR